ncbi:MAG: (d)CMP kinase, partial [Asticcacaulis sp.]
MKPSGALIIAFDGPAASGKGTLASVIAADHGLPFLDTGLLYRAVGYLAHVRNVSHDDHEALAALARHIYADLLADDALRGREAGERASRVAAIPAVRAALKQYQIDFAHQPSGAVLDGRDIGTVIAPD